MATEERSEAEATRHAVAIPEVDAAEWEQLATELLPPLLPDAHEPLPAPEQETAPPLPQASPSPELPAVPSPPPSAVQSDAGLSLPMLDWSGEDTQAPAALPLVQLPEHEIATRQPLWKPPASAPLLPDVPRLGQHEMDHPTQTPLAVAEESLLLPPQLALPQPTHTWEEDAAQVLAPAFQSDGFHQLFASATTSDVVGEPHTLTQGDSQEDTTLLRVIAADSRTVDAGEGEAHGSGDSHDSAVLDLLTRIAVGIGKLSQSGSPEYEEPDGPEQYFG